MPPLAPYILKAYDDDSIGFGENHVFRTGLHTPCLDNSRPNSILIFPGSFSPPHQGHLHLLRHVFLHGVHDLNAVAAIIRPHSDETVGKKVREAGGTFMFGIEERRFLWEQDVSFPEWAWVYKETTFDFLTFLKRLKQITGQDGYDVDFVMVFGPGIGSPDSPPTSAYGCKTVIMSDAARKAGFQRSNGRLRNFDNCTLWQKVAVDRDHLERHARAQAHQAMLRMHSKKLCPSSIQEIMVDDLRFVERTTLASVARATKDLERVLYCQHSFSGSTVTVRFVKARASCWKVKWAREISSTNVRNAMRKNRGSRLKTALQEFALSPDVLWHYLSRWRSEARAGRGESVNFPPMSGADIDKISPNEDSMVCYSNGSGKASAVDIPFEVDGAYELAKVSMKESEIPMIQDIENRWRL